MARWMLVCPRCYHQFEHSKVDPDVVVQALRDPFMVVPKPTFRSGGEIKKCPGCTKESLYRTFDLIYSGDETALGAAGSD
jgi:hypothetical protein